MNEAEAMEFVSRLYEESGGDPWLCEFCEEPLNEIRAWMRGIDGAGAHHACLQEHGIIAVVDNRGVAETDPAYLWSEET